jgi:molecular chaperone DnaK (HSP70)
MTVTNVASKSFGIEVLEDSEDPERTVISNLVLVQDQVPAIKTRTYSTVTAGQRRVDIRVIENNLRDPMVSMEHGRGIGLAVLTLSEDLPINAPVDVTFELTPDGRLKVTGRDLAEKGKEIVAVVETDRGLSDEELESAKERAGALRVSG